MGLARATPTPPPGPLARPDASVYGVLPGAASLGPPTWGAVSEILSIYPLPYASGWCYVARTD